MPTYTVQGWENLTRLVFWILVPASAKKRRKTYLANGESKSRAKGGVVLPSIEGIRVPTQSIYGDVVE